MKELINIQSELKAPKSQYNLYGKYNYRSLEDILEAVKPLLLKNKCFLTISDDIVEIGGRIYVKATATLTNEKGEKFINTAFAREAESNSLMSVSQITGATSSYARKYALNGLFCIDDTKDDDATNTHGKDTKTKTPAPAKTPAPKPAPAQPISAPATPQPIADLKDVARVNACKSTKELADLYAEFSANGKWNDEIAKVFTARKNEIKNATPAK